MMRRIFCAFLAICLCFVLAASVTAEPKAVDFVIDECGYLADSELEELNELALKLYEETGVGIFYAYITAESVQDYDVDSIVNGITDYVIMMENAEYWYVHTGGRGAVIDLDAQDELRAIYDETPTYVEGVAAFLNAAAEYFPGTVDTTEADVSQAKDGFVYDEADLLSDAEEATLASELMEISGSYNAQIVVCTISSMDGGDIDSYMDYLYDSMEFGYGKDRDGVLLLVCMDPREYRILSNGYAGVAIDPDAIAGIGDVIVSDLSFGDYASAFHSFAEECDYYLDGYLNGFPFPVGKSLLISLLIGVAAGLIVAFVLKGQLKSVRQQDRAHDYVKADSMNVTVRNDLFLYRDITRTEKESSDSSDSGSGGGTARSKGGGSF